MGGALEQGVRKGGDLGEMEEESPFSLWESRHTEKRTLKGVT